MPKDLIAQWIKAIDLIVPDVFDIYKYYGDARRSKSIADERLVLDNLHQLYKLFDEKE